MKTSSKKVQANRANARRSTGPRTVEGKRRAATNAFRHGLAVPIEMLPGTSEDVERLARLISGGGETDMPLAREVAAATLDLRRIQQARHTAVRRMLEDPLAWVDETIPQFFWRSRRGAPTSVLLALRLAQGHGTNARNPALAAFSMTLDRIARYERRALSRRKAAVRNWSHHVDSGAATAEPSPR